MESAWLLFLRQLASPDSDFTYDEVCGWSADEFAALTESGFVREISQATHVACDSCPEGHRECVWWSEDGERAWIACPAAGIVEVNPERLRRWRIDVEHFARVMSVQLELEQKPRALAAAGRLWHLGRRRFADRFRDVFFSASSDEQFREVVEEAQKQLPSGTGLLIVCMDRPADSGWEPSRLRAVTISEIATWDGRTIVLDLPFIEEIWSQNDAEARKAGPASLAVPSGAQWQDLTIEMHDTTLTIEVGGHQKQLSFAEAGFSERDQRLETLKVLAAARGHLAPERASEVLPGRTALKNRVNMLRRLLQDLIRIDGSPIVHERRAGIYQCRFRVHLAGDNSFPTPSGATWLDFRVVERHDGRLAVTVNERRVFRAHAREWGSGRRDEEVAQQQEPVARVFSLDEIGLRDSRGRLVREAQVLVELLRNEGKSRRQGDDIAVLKLAEWLRKWTGLENEPLLYGDRTGSWTACFECASDRRV